MMSPEEVHNALEVELEQLESLVLEVRHAGVEAAKAEVSYKVEHSKARLTVKATALEKLTVSEVDAEATIHCEELFLTHSVAQNAMTTIREALRASQARLDGLRTLMASFRQAGG